MAATKPSCRSPSTGPAISALHGLVAGWQADYLQPHHSRRRVGHNQIVRCCPEAAEPLSAFKNELVFDVAWLPGGQWLLARYEQKGPSYLRAQIGLIPRAEEPIQPITRDTNSYDTLSMSADGKTAATVQVRTANSLSLLPGAGTQGNTAVQALTQAQDVQSVAWAAEGKLLISDGQSVLQMNADGGQKSTIVSDPNSWIMDMARCGERYIVLAWAFHGGTTRFTSGEPMPTARIRHNSPTELLQITRCAPRMENGSATTVPARTIP